MIKNLSRLQSEAKHSHFAKELTNALIRKTIQLSPVVIASVFNEKHKTNLLKPHTVRKWLIGSTKPRSETLFLFAKWLDIDPQFLLGSPNSYKSGVDIDFTDQEVITKYLSMNLKQKAAVSILINSILDRDK